MNEGPTICLLLATTLSVLVVSSGRPPVEAVSAAQRDSVIVRVVADEAESAMAVLAKRAAGAAPDSTDLSRVFESDGYRRLKARETGMGRPFTDSAFRAFLLSDTLLRRARALDTTLAAYRRIDVLAAAARAKRYLPAGATIRATVFLVVKPRTNSFVFDFPDGRAIFLYVDPSRSAKTVEHDLVAHELHHIGYGATCTAAAADSSPAAQARRWLGAFGEGLAMLAAAGSADVDPHALSPSDERDQWRRDFAQWRTDLPRIEQFLLDVSTGRLSNPDSVLAVARSFYGEAQGPWYTVGYAMATTIEKAFARKRLVSSICDQRQFLKLYNDAARSYNQRRPAGDHLPLWSSELLERLGS